MYRSILIPTDGTEITAKAPGFAEYEKKATRVIPVFALQRVE